MSDKNSITTFPDPNAPKAVKLQKGYGLQQIRAMWAEYTRNAIVNNAFIQQMKINRTYAEGLESIEKYKDRLDLNGDSSWLNLDFSPVNRIASLCDNLEGKLTNQMYKIQCNPIDIASKTKEEKDRDEMHANMFLKQQAGDLEQLSGIPIYPRNKYIPADDEEAELYFKMNYKQASAIAMEQALQFVFMNNEFDSVTRKKIIRDLVVIKRAALKRYYDNNNNIRVKYVDPVDLITPYTKKDDFSNIQYVGEKDLIRIGEIAEMTDEFTPDQLEEIAKKYAGSNYGNPEWDNSWNSTGMGSYYPAANGPGAFQCPYYSFYVPVVNFYFLTRCKENWVKTTKADGRVFFDKQTDDYVITKKNKELISKEIEYVFEGWWIQGSEHVFNYKQSKNVPREKDSGSYSPKATLPIIIMAPNIYDMQNKSLVERAIPHEDQLNLINLKLQQLLIQAKPPGVAINKEALSGIMLGQGEEAAKPEDIYKMYAHTGSFVYSDVRDGGEIINGKPIEWLQNGIGEDFATLVNAYNAEMNKINDVIGYNNAVDASSPDAEAVVGAAKMAIQATNNSLRPLFQASVQLIERATRGIALMIQDSISENYDAFVRAIGTQATETIKYGKALALNQFAIKVELLPDEEEKMYLDQLIERGLEQGTLMTSDAILLRQEMKQDVKLAAQLMIYLENKNRKNRMAEEKSKVDYNTQQQVQSGQAVAQAQMEAEFNIAKRKDESLSLEYSLKDQLEERNHQRNMELEKLRGQNQVIVAEVSHEHAVRQSALDNSFKSNAETAVV
jgi:hypothetical protein